MWTNPYRSIGKFDPEDIGEVNREYYSTELFLRNNPTHHYNAFVFCSSRGSSINTYLWKTLLNDTINPFVFQAWGENLEGMVSKIDFLQSHNIPINHAIVLFDIPGSFLKSDNCDVISLRHYLLSGSNKFNYNFRLFTFFAQKPSQWVKASAAKIKGEKQYNEYDSITNDRFVSHHDNWKSMPPLDSLLVCSEVTRNMFLLKVRMQQESDIQPSSPMIDAEVESLLRKMKSVFDSQHTDYRILITPQYVYQYSTTNPQDLQKLISIFGSEFVFDYCEKSEYTTDYNYYSDPGHFGERLGFIMLKEIYGCDKR